MNYRLLLSLAVSLALHSPAAAGGLPSGGFKGSTPMLRRPDAMALLIKKDPQAADTHYAVLAEYDRLNGYIVPDRLAITRWVPRLFVYRVDPVGELRYALRPLKVTPEGEIVPEDVAPDSLTLAKADTLDGAVLIRHEKNSVAVAERITFKGKVGSTWENYIPGKFYGTNRKSGGDYFNKKTNTVLTPEGDAEFAMEEVKGRFKIAEKVPGLFTFTTSAPNTVGADKLLSRIGVFIDIVNWKPLFTTDELLLINPADPTDVGFFYERH